MVQTTAIVSQVINWLVQPCFAVNYLQVPQMLHSVLLTHVQLTRTNFYLSFIKTQMKSNFKKNLWKLFQLHLNVLF